MNGIEFQFIHPKDDKNITLIADWYLNEWNFPIQTTIEKINNLSVDKNEFHVLMTLDNKPVAAGGVHCHVSLLDKEPRLKMYPNWLALVYTSPEHRGKGFGAIICEFIQNHAKELGMKDLYLYTHTAERLYKRLGWQEMERLYLGGKDIVVMKKVL